MKWFKNIIYCSAMLNASGEIMDVFLFILTNNLIPIFTIIILGIIIDRRFHLDVSTLTKINLYIFVPLFVFVSTYTTEFPKDMFKAFAIVVLILAFNKLIGTVTGRLCRFDKGLTNAFNNSIMFYNSGNFGVPLITLIFSSKNFLVNGETPYLNYALSIQVIVLLIQNVSTSTIGVFNASHAQSGFKGAFVKAFKMPALYFIVAAFLLKLVPYDLTQLPVWPAFIYVGNGLVPLALISLGAQLSHTKISFKNPIVYLSSFIRLIVGPVIALILVLLFGLDGVMAQVLIISSAVPTAVNASLIGVEFNNHPDFCSQSVMMSTIFSAITLTGVIYMAGILFPV
jgi:predicted permease